MIEERVLNETARLLQKCGFESDRNSPHLLLVPTQTLAMRWLREEKKIYVDVQCITEDGTYKVIGFDWQITHINHHDFCRVENLQPTYEQAAEQAIAAACRYLLNQTKSE